MQQASAGGGGLGDHVSVAHHQVELSKLSNEILFLKSELTEKDLTLLELQSSTLNASMMAEPDPASKWRSDAEEKDVIIREANAELQRIRRSLRQMEKRNSDVADVDQMRFTLNREKERFGEMERDLQAQQRRQEQEILLLRQQVEHALARTGGLKAQVAELNQELFLQRTGAGGLHDQLENSEEGMPANLRSSWQAASRSGEWGQGQPPPQTPPRGGSFGGGGGGGLGGGGGDFGGGGGGADAAALEEQLCTRDALLAESSDAVEALRAELANANARATGAEEVSAKMQAACLHFEERARAAGAALEDLLGEAERRRRGQRERERAQEQAVSVKLQALEAAGALAAARGREAEARLAEEGGRSGGLHRQLGALRRAYDELGKVR